MSAYSGVVSRKGSVSLARLNIELSFESTIEERYLRVLDTCPQVLAVRRADTVTVMAPDGTSHSYTPDFEVTLDAGRTVIVECKPAELLGEIIQGDSLLWQQREQYFRLKGQEFRIITDGDLLFVRLEHVKHFARFVGVEVNPVVQEQALKFLRDRGQNTLQALRTYLQALLKLPWEGIDPTLNALISRQQLVADLLKEPPACLVDLPGRSITTPEVPLGQPVEILLRQPLPVRTQMPRLQRLELALEEKFLGTERGKLYLRLFEGCRGDPAVLKRRTEELAEENNLSIRTLQRFCNAMIDAGAPGITFADLVPFVRCENHKPRNQVSPEVYAIIQDKLHREYFIPAGNERARNVHDLYQSIRKEAGRRGLAAPSYGTVRAHIERFEATDPVLAMLRRDGREAADRYVARHGHFSVELYGELIAVDCTPCDVFTISENARMGVSLRTKKQRRADARRGHVVTVIDVATGEVLASEIFDGAISAANVLLVLRMIFLGDYGELKDLGVQTVPLARGLPSAIRMDSGNEFQNRFVEMALQRLGVEVLRRNKGTKHYGGREERTIQTLIHSHHALQGTSMHNITARGEYDAQLDAVWTMRELNIFHQLIVERYNNLTVTGQLDTRHDHAARLIAEGLSVWRPLSSSQLEHVKSQMMPGEMRKHLREGIKIHGLVYSSSALATKVPVGADVKVYYDPDDVSTALVVLKDGTSFKIEARLPNGVEPPFSLKEAQEIGKRVRQARQAAEDRVPTVTEIAQRVQEESRKKRQQVRVKKGKKAVPREDSGVSTIKLADLDFRFDGAPRQNGRSDEQ